MSLQEGDRWVTLRVGAWSPRPQAPGFKMLPGLPVVGVSMCRNSWGAGHGDYHCLCSPKAAIFSKLITNNVCSAAGVCTREKMIFGDLSSPVGGLVSSPQLWVALFCDMGGGQGTAGHPRPVNLQSESAPQTPPQGTGVGRERQGPAVTISYLKHRVLLPFGSFKNLTSLCALHLEAKRGPQFETQVARASGLRTPLLHPRLAARYE